MRIVYEPRGRAKEYAELACNLYIGCTHGCRYCFAPACMHLTREKWKSGVYVRKRALELFEQDASDMRKARDRRAILFSFLSDPYQPLEATEGITHRALEIILRNRLRSKVLTKGHPDLVSADFDLMSRADTELGFTISFLDDKLRKRWEPGAASIEDRLAMLKKAHDVGIRTWVSLEPVIDPEQALAVIREALPHVDYWKVGKLNHMKEIEKKIDWPRFRNDVLRLFAEAGKNASDYYIKHDLMTATAGSASNRESGRNRKSTS